MTYDLFLILCAALLGGMVVFFAGLIAIGNILTEQRRMLERHAKVIAELLKQRGPNG
ncbi:MAG: hypothetical protein GTN64_05610 [Candidatus Latescibacteria bacterium]|nr:hypothetical protein [Candidatus Latescibacterota bacterium]NIO78086.1 hypothetical protein [Candidatus Latescibacterota bacterium]